MVFFTVSKGRSRRQSSKRSIYKLNPVLDSQGLLRVGGRLKNALTDCDSKHPLLLPYKRHMTNIIIRNYHEAPCHLGTKYVLSLIRQTYQIIKGFKVRFRLSQHLPGQIAKGQKL